MPGNTFESSKPYLRIVGGMLTQKVDKDTEGAKLREYELPNGEKGSKWELRYKNWFGKIEKITFKETEYGDMCMIEFDDAILTINVDSRYFQDFACKIVGADFTKPIVVHPYDMETDGKRRTGVSLLQGDTKLKNYFYDAENKKNLHGFPEVNEDQKNKLKKNYWKVYFAEVAAFLTEQLKALKINSPVKSDKLPDAEWESIGSAIPPDADLPF